MHVSKASSTAAAAPRRSDRRAIASSTSTSASSHVQTLLGGTSFARAPTQLTTDVDTASPDCESVMNMSLDDSLSGIHNLSLEDIDECDAEDPQCVTEFVNEIYEWLRLKEVKYAVDPNYMTAQRDINHKMRAILIDWMFDVHLKFRLLNDTMFMTVNLVDRYLMLTQGSRSQLQLVGVTCMLIASKCEEMYAPEVRDFVYICDKAYSREQILQMERHILNTLGFDVAHPTPLHFLRRFSKAARSDAKAHTLSKYLLELVQTEYDMLQYRPSMLAASAVYLTRKMLHAADASSSSPSSSPKWNSTLRHYTGYSEDDLIVCARQMNGYLQAQQAKKAKLTAVFRKYGSRYFHVNKVKAVDV